MFERIAMRLYSLLYVRIAMFAGLEIYFDEVDYYTAEGDETGLSGISLSLRETQVPFCMEVIPTTIDVAKYQYNLTAFFSLDLIEEDDKAQSGETYIGVCNSFNTHVRAA